MNNPTLKNFIKVALIGLNVAMLYLFFKALVNEKTGEFVASVFLVGIYFYLLAHHGIQIVKK